MPVTETFTEEMKEDGMVSFLQAAMDAAWEAGLRPLGYEDTRQKVGALRYHLEDMRLLAKVRDK